MEVTPHCVCRAGLGVAGAYVCGGAGRGEGSLVKQRVWARERGCQVGRWESLGAWELPLDWSQVPASLRPALLGCGLVFPSAPSAKASAPIFTSSSHCSYRDRGDTSNAPHDRPCPKPWREEALCQTCAHPKSLSWK